MGSLLQDIGYGLRVLRKRPGPTLAVVLCLAIGIGANTAIFSVVDAVLLRPLPYPEPDRLVVVRDVYRAAGEESETPASAPNFVAWREHNRVFSDLAAINHRNYTLTGEEGDAEYVRGARVSWSLFPMLGVQPQIGRLFTADEDRPEAPFMALLSDGLWHRRFGADPGVLGKTLTVNDTPFVVVGVLPPGFQFPDGVDIWAPVRLDMANLPSWHDLDVVARLKPGVSLEQAQADLGRIAERLARELPDSNAGWGVKVLSLRQVLEGDVRPALLVLLGAVAFVLAIACANVANLELARITERDRELAVRVALGAGQGRIVRQLLVESVLLSLLGGAAGLLLASASLRPLVALSPVEVAVFRNVSINGRVLAFTLVVAVLTGLLFGLVPALKTSRPEIHSLLKEGARGSTGIGGRRFRSTLVMIETGLALVLLVGAGLMLRSFWHLGEVDPGFDPDGLLTVRVNLPGSSYPEPEQRATFYRKVVERIAVFPGVQGTAVTTTLPLARENITDEFTVEGRPTPPGEIAMTNSRMVSPDYFRVLGIPLRAGRLFTMADDASAAGVVIVSESMARRYWPDQDPVGRKVKRGNLASERPWLTVVGVVGDVKDTGLDLDSGPTWYMPFAQNPWNGANLVVRTDREPLSLAPAVRQAVQTVDPNQAIYDVATMEQLIAGTIARPRFSAVLLLVFAATALLLAMVGLYAVLSYSVRQRRHEIGVRMALGARPSDVLRMVLRQGLTLAVAGIALGLAAALLLTRLLRAQLFEVSPTDPWTYAALSLGLAAVALAANFLPARKATRVDPVVSLRSN
jgi:putative ABC transport system permease protein